MRVLFVCLGNICRSPTAEGVFRRMVEDAGLAARVTIDSAGTGGWHVGELPDPRTREAARARGYELAHRARQLVPEDFERFDLIVAMDVANLARIHELADGRRATLALLRSFDAESPLGAEVPDPYAGGAEGFEHVLDLCERACRGLLAHVRRCLSTPTTSST